MTDPNAKLIAAHCPACDTRIRFYDRPRMFDTLSCPECEKVFEVVALSPIRLRWVDDGSFEDKRFDDFDTNRSRWYC